MTAFQIILLTFLVVCAIAVSFSKNLVNSVLIFMSYSLIMSIVWICLESPDLAITEAAVGAGVTTVLFIITLRKLRVIHFNSTETPDIDDAIENTVKQDNQGEEETHEQA